MFPIFRLDFHVLSFLLYCQCLQCSKSKCGRATCGSLNVLIALVLEKVPAQRIKMRTSNEFSSLAFIQLVLFLLKQTVATTENYFAHA